jgi:hypothetical protein
VAEHGEEGLCDDEGEEHVDGDVDAPTQHVDGEDEDEGGEVVDEAGDDGGRERRVALEAELQQRVGRVGEEQRGQGDDASGHRCQREADAPA